MKQIETSIVRKHFLICQRSGRDRHLEFETIKQEVMSLTDEEVKREILEKCAGKNDQSNSILLDDNFSWGFDEIEIDNIINPYGEFRQKIQFPELSSTKEIIKVIKEKYLEDSTIKELMATDINKLKRALPIFAIRKNDLIQGHDGWYRILALRLKGFEKIPAYIASRKNN